MENNNKANNNYKKRSRLPIILFCGFVAALYIFAAVFSIIPALKSAYEEMNKPDIESQMTGWVLCEYEKFDTVKTHLKVTNNTDETIKITYAYLTITDEDGNVVLECNDMVPGWTIEPNETIYPSWTACYGFDYDFFKSYVGELTGVYKFDYYNIG